jgi:putative ABC transport system permease protein
MNGLLQDVRYALRQLRKNPGLTAIILLTLALGIGANTAIFTVVEAALLRSLPYPDANKIVELEDYSPNRENNNGAMAVLRVADIRDQNHTLADVAYYYYDDATLSIEGKLPERVKTQRVSGDFWNVMGAPAFIGRTFGRAEDSWNGTEVAVLSYGKWQQLFGGNRSVIGKQVVLNGKSATIIGVMPAAFNYPAGAEMWAPSHFPLEQIKFRSDASRFMGVLARIRPQISLQVAQSDLNVVAARLAAQYPETDSQWQFRIVPLRETLTGNIRPALLVLMGAVGLVLLIACANVANLLLSRATSRYREFAMRQALGAETRRLLRQLFTESMTLAILGGGLGLCFAAPLTYFLATKLPVGFLPANSIHVNGTVLLFTCGVCLLTAVSFGLAPSLSLLKVDLQRTLKGSEAGELVRGKSWARNALVGVEIGLSLVLLVGAGLLVETFWKLQRVELGFRTDHLLTFQISFPWGTKEEIIHAFYNGVLARVENLPGVMAVGTISSLPFENFSFTTPFWQEGHPRPADGGNIVAEIRSTSGNYFSALGIPLIAGRLLTEQDDKPKAPPVGLIDQVVVERYFPHENPIGKRLLSDNGWSLEIVGIVGRVRGGNLRSDPKPTVYTPEHGWPMDSFAVRTQGDPQSLATSIREQVRQMDRGKAVYKIQTMDDMLSQAVSQPRLNTFLLGSFAALALLLASVGVYGVTAYLVAERTREIGIRMALGAPRMQIVSLFLRQAGGWALAGGAAGLIAALFILRMLQSLVFAVTLYDPTLFGGVALLLAVVVLAACFIPARRAAKVDPMVALRYE